MFRLDEKLSKDCDLVTELHFCQLLLMNDKQYPWLILVPKVSDIEEVYELTREQQHNLWDEVAETSKALKQIFNPDKLNIGALGNIVRQLHVHVVARFKEDIAWPGPVWGAHPPKAYPQDEKEKLIKKLKQKLVPVL
ncbi:MAG: HIT family protein [Gammaproteobacteria bacterium]|nr:HIT family protein [Gammaproteobacteria bacterium]